jgi:two-component system response regulator NreC
MSDTNTKPIRVLCVDDHAFLVDGLRARLEVEPDMEFAGRLETADDLVSHAREKDVDIVLLDIEMPGADVFEAIYELRHQCPDVRTILLSAHARDSYLEAAFKAGAWGYLTKSDDPDEVILGIRRVLAGDSVVSPALQMRQGRSKLSRLTEREKQILRMIANGLSRTEIAEALCRSPMTIDNHRKSILKKLGIHDRVELVRYAIAEGLGEL